MLLECAIMRRKLPAACFLFKEMEKRVKMKGCKGEKMARLNHINTCPYLTFPLNQ